MSVITVRRISNAQVKKIQKEKSQDVKEKIMVQVYTDKDGKLYPTSNPTYVYILPSKRDCPDFIKRTIPVYRSTVSNFSVNQVISKTISTSNVIKFY